MSTETQDADPTLSVMREIAERAVSQAKEAYSRSAAFNEGVQNTFDDWGRQVLAGAREVSYRAVSFADENVRRGFEHAERLAKAKDMGEWVSLQHEHAGDQVRRVVEQMRDLGEMSARTARGIADSAVSAWTDVSPSSER